MLSHVTFAALVHLTRRCKVRKHVEENEDQHHSVYTLCQNMTLAVQCDGTMDLWSQPKSPSGAVQIKHALSAASTNQTPMLSCFLYPQDSCFILSRIARPMLSHSSHRLGWLPAVASRESK